MGSVQDTVECPKCGQVTYDRELYYRTSEEFCFCLNCGYHYSHDMVRNEKHELVRKVTKTYDLAKESILYAAVELDDDYKVKNVVKTRRILPTDTTEDVCAFLDLFIRMPFSKKEYEIPEKFKDFEGTEKCFHNIFVDESFDQLWYLTRSITITDGKLEIHDAEWRTAEGGGYGVVLETSEYGGYARSLDEGEIPVITKDTIFASAIVDGRLTVLKELEMGKAITSITEALEEYGFGYADEEQYKLMEGSHELFQQKVEEAE